MKKLYQKLIIVESCAECRHCMSLNERPHGLHYRCQGVFYRNRFRLIGKDKNVLPEWCRLETLNDLHKKEIEQLINEK